jgi:hypothetical protein
MNFFSLLTVLFLCFISPFAWAGGTASPVADESAQPLEISGAVDALAGYQHDGANALASSQSITNPFGAGGFTQGDLGITPANSADHFLFALDAVQLTLNKEFGKNLRVHTDLIASDLTGTARRVGDVFEIEQAYVTFDFDGMEWMVGKFNIPMGIEACERYQNEFITFTPGNLALTPTNVIGTKLYWEFSDHLNIDVGFINNMNGAIAGNSAIPTGFARLGYVWGQDNRQSNANFTFAVGPEQNAAVSGASHNAHLDWLGDTWGQIYLNDRWHLGFEGTYIQSDASAAGAKNQKGIAGQIYGVWDWRPDWAFKARLATLWDINPISGALDGMGSSTNSSTWGGFEGWTYALSLCAQHDLTDAAFLRAEYRYDYAQTAGPTANPGFHTVVAEFAYRF